MTNITGYTAPGFDHVREAFATNFAEDMELGAGFAAILDGETVVDLQGGFADKRRTRPWGPRTLVPVYSTTKGVAALVLAGLVDELNKGYETPVAEVWPAFAAKGKAAVTIGQVVSHQAGLPGFMEPIDPALWLDPPACAAALADLAPLWEPGTAHGYHPLTWGYLVGEIARRLSPTGKTLGQLLDARMTNTSGGWDDGEDANAQEIDFWIGLAASEHDRCAEIMRPRALPDLGKINDATRAAFLTKWAAPDRGGAIWREIEIPSANGHGTALSVAQLYAAYATGGQQGRNHVTMSHAVTRQRVIGQDLVLPFVTEFAAGVMRNNLGLYGPNPETLAHSGWGGSMALADPDLRLSAGYVMNRQSNHLQGDPRARRLVEALYQDL